MTKTFDDELFDFIRDHHLSAFGAPRGSTNPYSLPDTAQYFFLNCLKGEFKNEDESEDIEKERKTALGDIAEDLIDINIHKTLFDILNDYLSNLVILEETFEGDDVYFSTEEKIFLIDCLVGNYSNENRISALCSIISLIENEL